MSKNESTVCQLTTKSCLNFKKINNLIIKMVNDHYFDLQMYANFVFDIDNDKQYLSKKNNFQSRIMDIQKKYNPEYPNMQLFTNDNMNKLRVVVSKMLTTLKDNMITADQYLSDIVKMEFFGSGAASSTILIKAYRKLSDSQLMPIIVKLIPFQLPHHYDYLPMSNKKQEFILTYIEAPGYALFMKEAWMYCFSKNELLKYTPTFTCIANCYIINGLPVKKLESLASAAKQPVRIPEKLNALTNIYKVYANNRIAAGKKLPYKKWFNILLNPNSDQEIKESIMQADYGCFEMKQIEGTLDDIQNIPGSFNLSIIFEYLYTKLVAAFVGRIIFTDDHFGNVAFDTVNYARIYKIKCNGCDYTFYMPPGKMVQFIDLERYVFNYSQYDIYTNTALKSITENSSKDFTKNSNVSNHFDRIKNQYKKNNYIFDKSLSELLSQSFNENNFDDPNEYKLMLQILTSPFVHDIKTFCQIMEANLPKKYLVPSENMPNVQEYYLDLDNDSLRVINLAGFYEQLD